MAAGRHDADIVVIGGGPAGSAAAITCAKRGLSVVVLERDRVFGERPGETMHPGVRPILEQLGLGKRIDALATGLHAGIWIEWGGPPRFQAFALARGRRWRGYPQGSVGLGHRRRTWCDPGDRDRTRDDDCPRRDRCNWKSTASGAPTRNQLPAEIASTHRAIWLCDWQLPGSRRCSEDLGGHERLDLDGENTRRSLSMDSR